MEDLTRPPTSWVELEDLERRAARQVGWRWASDAMGGLVVAGDAMGGLVVAGEEDTPGRPERRGPA